MGTLPAVPIQSCLPSIRTFSDIPMGRSYTGLGSLSRRAKLLGHEDISTTEIYAETDPEMAAEAISKMLGKQPVRKWDFLTEDEKLKILGLK